MPEQHVARELARAVRRRREPEQAARVARAEPLQARVERRDEAREAEHEHEAAVEHELDDGADRGVRDVIRAPGTEAGGREEDEAADDAARKVEAVERSQRERALGAVDEVLPRLAEVAHRRVRN